MSVAAALPDPAPIYDAGSRQFNGDRLKWEMVRRNLSPEDLARRTGLSLTLVKKARRGESIRERSARLILRELDKIEPMTVGSV